MLTMPVPTNIQTSRRRMRSADRTRPSTTSPSAAAASRFQKKTISNADSPAAFSARTNRAIMPHNAPAPAIIHADFAFVCMSFLLCGNR